MSAVNIMLSDRESEVLDELCAAADISKTGLMRQALRMYQLVQIKRSKGLELAFVDASGKVEKTLIVGLPAFD